MQATFASLEERAYHGMSCDDEPRIISSSLNFPPPLSLSSSFLFFFCKGTYHKSLGLELDGFCCCM